MPARQPFTQLCLALARNRRSARVDLHMHTTHSDGLYTPEQVVDLARRSGMPAIAITDHDTVSAIEPARRHAQGKVQIVSGVEISCDPPCARRGSPDPAGPELHLLGYFFDPLDADLNAALADAKAHRRERFFAMADRLRRHGIALPEESIERAATTDAVGRRHLAHLLVAEKKVGTIRDAFNRYLGDRGLAFVPKRRIPVADAITLVRKAGGVAAWAHPGDECTPESLRDLYNLGMRAVEVDWPTVRFSRSRVLRQWAKSLDMATTAGSDCHGPDQPRNAIGARGIDLDDLDRLQSLAGQTVSLPVQGTGSIERR
jgi:predicted metal-dependent phosphoesterase TrpH